MAPGDSRRPAAKYKKSVEARPRSVTAAPCERAPSGSRHPDEGRPDGAAHLGVELIGHGSPDVIGLEDVSGIAHGGPSLPERFGGPPATGHRFDGPRSPPATPPPGPTGEGGEGEHAETGDHL